MLFKPESKKKKTNTATLMLFSFRDLKENKPNDSLLNIIQALAFPQLVPGVSGTPQQRAAIHPSAIKSWPTEQGEESI